MNATGNEQSPLTAIDPILLPRVMIWSVIVAILSFTVADPDLWGHVRFGMDIIALRGLPTTDPYSFTSDQPWVNHEWLSEVVMGSTYQAAGAVGLAVLKLTLLVAAFAGIVRELRARGVPPMAQDGVLMVCLIGCVILTKTLRPQTFSLLLFVLLLSALRRAEDGQQRRVWWAPPILMLWANLHGGWLVGLGVQGVWTAVRCLAPRGPSRLVWAASGITSVIATLATPEGVGMWVFLWKTVGLGRADIGEWQPLSGVPLLDALPWVITSAVAIVAVIRSSDRRVSHLGAVAALMFVSFRVWRVVPFFAVATAMLLAPSLVRLSSGSPKRPKPLRASEWLTLAAMVAAFMIDSAVFSYRSLGCLRMQGSWIADRQAAAAIARAGISGNTLTWFDWGEYAIWFLTPQIRVSMDGRRETVYSDDVLQQHLAIYYGRPGWQEQLRRLDPEHIWLPTALATVQQIEALGWKPVLSTPQSVVFSRTSGLLAAPEPSSNECFPGPP